jgi:hypothetical protein
MPEAANIPIDKVQQLQIRLWMCAKRSRTRRFHALYDRIYRSDVLWEAWKRVRSNKGAAGVDAVTLRSIEERGVAQFLEGIQADLKAGRYRPQPPGKYYMQRWPSPKATRKLRDRVRELTDARQSGKGVKQIIAELNPVLRGWGKYFRTGNADREFNKLDGFVFRRIRRWQYRRGGQRATRKKAWTGDQLYGMGLHRLQGRVCYPSQATSPRSSLSCVRENRMHSLKGGYMETGQR